MGNFELEVANCDVKLTWWKTNVTLCFTELGAVMAANILKSDYAVRMSVLVVRTEGKTANLLIPLRGEIFQNFKEVFH